MTARDHQPQIAGVIRIGTGSTVDGQHMCSGRVTDSIYMTEIEPAAFLLIEKPLKDKAGVVQTGGKLPFRCDAIGEIDHGEPALCQVHAVILIAFLVSVGPSAAMDADNDREWACG